MHVCTSPVVLITAEQWSIFSFPWIGISYTSVFPFYPSSNINYVKNVTVKSCKLNFIYNSDLMFEYIRMNVCLQLSIEIALLSIVFCLPLLVSYQIYMGQYEVKFRWSVMGGITAYSHTLTFHPL